MVGVPYKIFAVSAGLQEVSPFTFVLMSLWARGLRFLLSVLLTALLCLFMTKVLKMSKSGKFTVFVVFWSVFYSWYWSKVGI